jgi:hypothetical protein
MIVPVIGIYKNPIEDVLFFDGWLPEKNNIMTYEKKNMSVTIWFDIDCVPKLFSSYNFDTLDENLKQLIKEYKNKKQIVNQVYIDINVNNLSDEIVKFIFEEEKIDIKNETEAYKKIVSQYKQLTINVVDLSISILNRMFIYFRNYKRHYWLLEYNIDSDKNNFYAKYSEIFSMKVKSNIYDWINWNKLSTLYGILLKRKDKDIEKFQIKKEEWIEAKTYIIHGKKFNNFDILKTLANVDLLVFQKYHRNALVEGVIALESAASGFQKSAKYEEIAKLDDGERLQKDQIEVIKKLLESKSLKGIEAKIDVIAVIFSLLSRTELIPKNILMNCKKAIEQRNNIVHQNSYKHERDTNEDYYDLLESIKYVCDILIKYS